MKKPDDFRNSILNPAKKKVKQETNQRDNWYTPKWVVKALWEAGIAPRPEHKVIEPSAGAGSIVECLLEMGIKNITVVELRNVEDLRELVGPRVNARFIRGDFLRLKFDERFDYAVLNPPYSLAFDFVKKCLEIADKVVALLGSNFYYSQDRYTFNRDYKPDIHAFAERPSFIKAIDEGNRNEKPKKGTDLRDRAWYVYPGNNHHELIPPRRLSEKKVMKLI